MRTINRGDLARFEYRFPDNSFQMVRGYINSTPADVGDMWYVQLKDEDGKVVALNPTCSWLVGVFREKTAQQIGKESSDEPT